MPGHDRGASPGLPLRMAAAAVCLAGPAALCAAPVLNEVLYDPDGADAGREFIELFNPGPQAWPLDGCRVEFANGAVAVAWQTRWTGGPTDTIAAGGFFLIVDRGWSGDPDGDAIAALSLQNGPDAVRLRLPDGRQDRLGYGQLDDPAFYEGQPHPGSGSGRSLARRPDGHDTDHNASDWATLDRPTPGAANFAARVARVTAFEANPPSSPAPGLPVVFSLEIANQGLEPLPAATARLAEAGGGELAAGWLEALEPGQRRALRMVWPAAREGRLTLELRIDAGDGLELRPPAGVYQVGITDLYLSEVMAAPAAGSCEWIEIGNAGTAAVELGDHVLRDEDGVWRALPAITVAPGGWALLVQNRDRFRDWWQQLVAKGAPLACGDAAAAAARSVPAGWPSLNNSAPSGRDFADRVYLGLAGGVVIDHVTLGAGGQEVPAARSLERVSVRPRGAPERNWGPANTPGGGTPACRNSLTGPDARGGGLRLAPNPFAPSGGGEAGTLHLRFEVGEKESGWDARVYDLWGRLVRDLGGDRLGGGPRDVLWDGRDDTGAQASPGAYIVLVRRLDGAGRPGGGDKALAVLREGR